MSHCRKYSLTTSSRGAATCTRPAVIHAPGHRECREHETPIRTASPRAVALGWRDEQIIVIDNDQGESGGTSAAWRQGFQHLVTDVKRMGHAGDRDGPRGLTIGKEQCRLASPAGDLRTRRHALILDEDGIYDPANFNDEAPKLGLKGTMSRSRASRSQGQIARGRILNKARRGEYHCPLPTGFVYDEAGKCRA